MSAAPVDYDCVRCGACCRAEPGYGGGVYVRLDPGDEERFSPEQARALLETTPSGRRALRLVRDAEGHQVCKALGGRVGERVACGIYAARPSACRAFAAGTPECRLARVEAGLPPEPPLRGGA